MHSYQKPADKQTALEITPTGDEKIDASSLRKRKITAKVIGYSISTLSMVNDTLAFISGREGDISKMAAIDIIPTAFFAALDLLPNITYTNKAVGCYLGVPSDHEESTLTPSTTQKIIWLSMSVPGALFDGFGAVYNFGLTTSNTIPTWIAYLLGNACTSNTFLSEGTEIRNQITAGGPPTHAWFLRMIPYALGAATLVPEVITTYLPVANFLEVSEEYKLPLFAYVIYTNGIGDFCYNTAEQCTGFWATFWESVSQGLPDGKTIFDFALSGGVSVWINWMLAGNFLRYQTELRSNLPFSMDNEFINNFFWGCLLIRNSINGTAYLHDYFPTATTFLRNSTSTILKTICKSTRQSADDKEASQTLVNKNTSLSASPTSITTYTDRSDLATPPPQADHPHEEETRTERQTICSRLSSCSIM